MPQPIVKKQHPKGRLAHTVPHANSQTVLWEDAAEPFLRVRRSENLSPSTLQNYRWHLLGPRATAFREDRQLIGPEQLTADAIRCALFG